MASSEKKTETKMKRFTVAARLWTPTVSLAAMLALAGGATAVRTQKLIAASRNKK